DQNPVQLAVGDKEAVVVVDGQPIDPAKVGLVAVADELGFVGLDIEDEDGANFLIGDIHQSLGIDGNAVGANQLVGKRLGIDLFFVGLASGEPVHPRGFGFAVVLLRVIDLLAGKV